MNISYCATSFSLSKLYCHSRAVAIEVAQLAFGQRPAKAKFHINIQGSGVIRIRPRGRETHNLGRDVAG